MMLCDYGHKPEVMKIAKRYLQKGETIYETKTYAGGGHQVLIARFKNRHRQINDWKKKMRCDLAW